MYKFNLAGVQLPVAPNKNTWKMGNSNKNMDLVNGSEINFLRTPGLTEFSFDVLLPAVKYPFAEYPDGFEPANYYLELLKKLKTEKRSFLFSIYRSLPSGKVLFDTYMQVSLESYKVTEDAGEGFDIKVNIELKQYIEHKTVTYTEIKSQSRGTAVKLAALRSSDKETPKTYTVKSGDTLWAICKAQLGDGSKYKEIASLNGISNPNLIYPGQVIRFA